MSSTEFQLQAICDPRLAVHATSAHPVWLWSADGKHVLWANPVGARLFGAANSAELAAKDLRPRGCAPPPGRATRQPPAALGRDAAGTAARLRRAARHAHDLRLRAAGFSRRQPRHPDHTRSRPRCAACRSPNGCSFWSKGLEMPIAAFDRDGTLVGASEAAGSLLDLFSQADLEQARADALVSGHVELPIADRQRRAPACRQRRRCRVVALIMPACVEANRSGVAAGRQC